MEPERDRILLIELRFLCPSFSWESAATGAPELKKGDGESLLQVGVLSIMLIVSLLSVDDVICCVLSEPADPDPDPLEDFDAGRPVEAIRLPIEPLRRCRNFAAIGVPATAAELDR